MSVPIIYHAKSNKINAIIANPDRQDKQDIYDSSLLPNAEPPAMVLAWKCDEAFDLNKHESQSVVQNRRVTQ